MDIWFLTFIVDLKSQIKVNCRIDLLHLQALVFSKHSLSCTARCRLPSLLWAPSCQPTSPPRSRRRVPGLHIHPDRGLRHLQLQSLLILVLMPVRDPHGRLSSCQGWNCWENSMRTDEITWQTLEADGLALAPCAAQMAHSIWQKSPSLKKASMWGNIIMTLTQT